MTRDIGNKMPGETHLEARSEIDDVKVGPINLRSVFKDGRVTLDDGFIPEESESERAKRFWCEATINGQRKLSSFDHMHLEARIQHPQRYAEALRKFVAGEGELELSDLLLEAYAEFWRRRGP